MEKVLCLFCKQNDARNIFCSSKCSSDYKKQEADKHRRQQFLEGKLKQRFRIYHFLVERDGNKCQVCNAPGVWNNKPLRLWVDHIDGNAANNIPSNFRLICPNCESQTETSRGHNYGKGRGSRGLAPYG
jgi:hypothetical protein